MTVRAWPRKEKRLLVVSCTAGPWALLLAVGIAEEELLFLWADRELARVGRIAEGMMS